MASSHLAADADANPRPLTLVLRITCQVMATGRSMTPNPASVFEKHRTVACTSLSSCVSISAAVRRRPLVPGTFDTMRRAAG